MKQPRRYAIRKMVDVEKLSQREVAERLQISAATVNRELAETLPPAGFTTDGTPFYPPGRFDKDPEFVARVFELARRMPHKNAKRVAAKEFAGPRPRRTMLGQIERIRTDAEKRKILDDFDRGKAA